MKKAIISLLVAGAVIAANAQDKALLETLVKKGMLTQQEAAQIAKDSVAVTPATKSTKSIKIFGGGQGWYSWGKNSVKAGTGSFDQQSGFTLRYVKLGIEADVGGGWSGSSHRLRHRRRFQELSRQGRSLQEDRPRLPERNPPARSPQGKYGLRTEYGRLRPIRRRTFCCNLFLHTL